MAGDQNAIKVCGDTEAKQTAELLDKSDLEAGYKLFAECWNGDEAAFYKYVMKTNSLEKNGVGVDFSIVINDRFPRVVSDQSGRNLHMDSYNFE